MGAEDFLQGLDGQFGEGMKLALPSEEAIGNDRVDMGMKTRYSPKVWRVRMMAGCALDLPSAERR